MPSILLIARTYVLEAYCFTLQLFAMSPVFVREGDAASRKDKRDDNKSANILRHALPRSASANPRRASFSQHHRHSRRNAVISTLRLLVWPAPDNPRAVRALFSLTECVRCAQPWHKRDTMDQLAVHRSVFVGGQ